MYYLEGENEPLVEKVALSTSIPSFSDWSDVALVANPPEPQNKENSFQGLFERKSFEISGLSIKFANLKTDEDILNFANSYGLLGAKYTQQEILKYDYYYLAKFEYDKTSIMESLSIWRWHIGHVKKLIKLYKALTSGRDLNELIYVDRQKEEDLFPPPALLQYLRQEKPPETITAERIAAIEAIRAAQRAATGQAEAPKVQKKPEPEFHYYWSDGKPTLLPYKEPKDEKSEEEELKIAATIILRRHLFGFLEEGIFIDFSDVRKDPTAPLGFGFVDRKATNHLLAAIYYDLFRKVNNLDPVELCKQCNTPFIPKRKDAQFCGKTCQKRQERADKQKSLGA